MPRAVLTGLKNYRDQVNLYVVSAMLDSGGSAGEERKKYNTGVSFGDIRRAAYAVSGAPDETKELLNSRFQEGPFKGHVVSNLNCSAKVKKTGDPMAAIDYLVKEFRIPSQYKIFPATFDDANLVAELENGEVIEGETNIDIPKHDENLKIKKVSLVPEAKAFPGSVEAIKNADLIVIGPGDLYSSIAQILLVQGIPDAIRESKAKKAYFCNLMTKKGETNGFSVLDFSCEVEKYLGSLLDFVVFNTNEPDLARLVEYKREHPELIDFVEPYRDSQDQKKFIGRELMVSDGPIIHDPEKVAEVILSLL